MSHKWNHNFPKIAREAGFAIRELSVGHCIDWRFIASIDPYSIVSERDYEKLDEFIPHISEVPIGSVLNNRILDPAIGKYFVLAQFSVQYLLFCKQFLDETVMEIRNTAQDVQKENARLEKICRKKNDELMTLHRRLQRAENVQIQQHAVYPCSKCTKNFISSELLHSHMVRKHGVSHEPEPSVTAGRKLSETDSNLINTIKLELEVKQLKERLNVAEKDLMDQRSRDHRCHSCEKDRPKEREQPEQSKQVPIEVKSIAIQSNLEDFKDVNEKEVQTSIRSKTPETPPRLSPIQRLTPSPVPLDYISKSDLEAIVREQKEQFEAWKTLEREKFNGEIEQVRRNLTAAIHELEKRPAPIPEQRHVHDEEDDRIWKQRYHELERMYENSQRQVRETVQNVEAVYEDKFKQLERRMERKEAAVETRREESKVLLPPPEQEQQVESEIDEAIEEHGSASEEPAQTESDDEIRALEAAKARFLAKIAVEPPPEVSHEVPQKPERKLISPKKQIMNTFKTRLKSLGIDPKAKSLPKDDLNTVAEAMAERRDVNRKKNRGFFITRNQLLAKVDQIAKGKIGESSKQLSKSEDLPVIKKKESAPQPVPKFRSSLQTPSEILPDRPNALKTTTSNANLFKIKSVGPNSNFLSVPEVKHANSNDEILTVQAEINALPPSLRTSPRASFSEYERHLERLLDTPIKQVGTPPDLITVEGRKEADQSDSSDLNAAKPVPRKRVLFNLDKQGSGTTDAVPIGPTLSSTVIHVSKADEESDWNISSFEDEK
ncbi:cilium assembly protein DZIP1L [Culex pipiens pallens]|uniref:cilium assembly protein DZIP1L n=1 Tax=Culex pipiens pallens TaxID=42434 RepID=UPI001954760D|nr:cilium assembly protein DZIP1L [Culex pipiens pallens]